jgi:hypothetical protein
VEVYDLNADGGDDDFEVDDEVRGREGADSLEQ